MTPKLLLLALCISSLANSELISVQFQGGGTAQTGAAATGSTGDYWNHITSGSTGSNIALEDSTGAATGVTISYTADCCLFTNSGANGYGPGQGLATGYIARAGTVTLSGLAASQAYTLYTYDQRDIQSSSTIVTVNGVVQTTVAGPSSSYVLGKNYLVFNTSSNTSGVISISFARAADEGDFNGLQLTTGTTATPEPATTGLLGAGMLGLLIQFRKRREKMRAGIR